MIDMSITAKYDNKTRDALAGQIKGWALKYNQYQDELQEAVVHSSATILIMCQISVF